DSPQVSLSLQHSLQVPRFADSTEHHLLNDPVLSPHMENIEKIRDGIAVVQHFGDVDRNLLDHFTFRMLLLLPSVVGQGFSYQGVLKRRPWCLLGRIRQGYRRND